jgi:hypothetical protein
MTNAFFCNFQCPEMNAFEEALAWTLSELGHYLKYQIYVVVMHAKEVHM